MEKLIGLQQARKQRDPYVEMKPGGPGGPPDGIGPGSPGGPGSPDILPPMFTTDEHSKACIVVDHGTLETSGTDEGQTGSTAVSAAGADGLQIITSDGHTGGIYCTGDGTNFILENAVISIAGNSPDSMLGGKSTAVEATDHAKVIIRNCDISASGVSRSTTVCENYGEMHIYDSTLVAHGAPWGTSAREKRPSARFREFEGNARNHCTMSNGKTWFSRCKIYTDGWAAVSTDAAQGYVYVQADDCDIRTRSGYAAYADNGCHDVFNRCTITSGAMAAVLAGECSIQYNGCKIACDTYFAKVHCVMGRTLELGALEVNGCDIHSGNTALLVSSANAEIVVRASLITAENGALLRAEKNDDPCATDTKGQPVYGVHATFVDCNLTGNIVSADQDRDVYVYLQHTQLHGSLHGSYLQLDELSSWTATSDSEIILLGIVNADQLDAPTGVTIYAQSGMSGRIPLQSGGTLILTKAAQ